MNLCHFRVSLGTGCQPVNHLSPQTTLGFCRSFLVVSRGRGRHFGYEYNDQREKFFDETHGRSEILGG
jgi:hypothetical protein